MAVRDVLRSVFVSVGDFPGAATVFGAPDDGTSLATFLRTGWVGRTRYFFRSAECLSRRAESDPDAWDELTALNELRRRRAVRIVGKRPSRRGRPREEAIPIERYEAAFAMLRTTGETYDAAVARIASALGREEEGIRAIIRRGANSA